MEGLTPSQKGAIAETAIIAHATRLGIDVYRPVAEGGRCDLIFHVRDRLLRIQCKLAALRKGVVRVAIRTFRHTPSGYVTTKYTADEIDAVVAYCRETDECYFLPASMAAGRNMIYLRVTPARNSQERRINWATPYRLGAIAQLGERVTGSHEAAGSSPASST
jgi:PD-(D/E)XK endonuclease